MSSGATLLTVWNRALDHLVEHALARPDDDNAYARWLRRNNDIIRDAFLRAHVWNFAVEMHSPTADATAPAFKWDYRYPTPSDCLRVLPPTEDGERAGKPVPFEVAGGWIMCNESTLHLRTVQRVTDYGDWDPLAIEALALKMAHDMCNRFTSKATYKDRLLQDYGAAMQIAMTTDSIEGTPDTVEQHEVIDARMV